MSEIVFLVEEAPEGGYTGRALGEAIFTEADTLDELRSMVRDAVRCHFDEPYTPILVPTSYGTPDTDSQVFDVSVPDPPAQVSEPLPP
jgi:hypothetical protein